MATTERREYFAERVQKRTVSPTRTGRNVSNLDSNLDNLLEDLQNSVTPTGTLGGSYRETSRTVTTSRDSSGDRVQHLSAANPTTVVSDSDQYGYKPLDGGQKSSSYKKEVYEYKSNSLGPEQRRMQHNIDQLDNLLDDLQQVRKGTYDKGVKSSTGIDSGLLETDPTPGKHQEGVSKRTVHRELVYDSHRGKASRSPQRSDREGSVTREIEYIDEGTYGDIKPIRQPSPSGRVTPQPTKITSISGYKSLTKDTIVTEPVTDIVETTESAAINPEVLAHLDPSILPTPNTKVTTTIKTYTYELPGTGYPSTISPKLNESERYYSPSPAQSTPSKSFVYNKIESTSAKNVTDYPKEYHPSPSPVGGSETYVYKETTTNRNVKENIPPARPPISDKQTYIYNESSTTRNVNYPGSRYPREAEPLQTTPPSSKTYVLKENITTENINYPGYPKKNYPEDDYPGKQTYVYNETTTKSVNAPRNEYPVRPANETYIIKETHNTTTNVNAPYPNGYPPQEPSQKTIIYKHDSHTTNTRYPPGKPYPDTETFDPKNLPPHGAGPKPGEPRDINIQYTYKSQHTSSNNYKGYPNEESQPLLHPQPFPTDSPEAIGPPKKLDELMANIGQEPPTNAYNAAYIARQTELDKKKEIEKQVEKINQDTQKKQDIKDLPKTKNVAGPPVYYPPGHEMFAHKEESGAWRAEGGMMRESGKYKYEAESSSKTKGGKGMAVVPVCLPLCCGLPCVIM